MKKILCIALLSLFFFNYSNASEKSFSFYCKRKIIGRHFASYENRLHTYNFRIEVISNGNGVKSEYHYGRSPFIKANMGETYSVKLYNPLPVRVAVNLMIDGLNTVTGNPCSPSGGGKWLIAPYSSVIIKGWQVSQESMRKFYFTTRQNSYAKWRSNQLGQDLSVKCGVISASYFWSKSEIENYFENNPVYTYHHHYPDCRKSNKDETFSSIREKCMPPRQYAGTGMGEKHGNQIEYVDFHYDTGMYSSDTSVKIYYDFVRLYPIYRKHTYREPDYQDFAPEKP